MDKSGGRAGCRCQRAGPQHGIARRRRAGI